MSIRRDARTVALWLLIAAAVGFVIWWRELRGSHPRPAAQPTDVVGASSAGSSNPRIADDAGVVTDAAAVVTDAAARQPTIRELAFNAPPRISQNLSLWAISTDGTRALLTSYLGDRQPLRMRVVVIDTGAIESELVLSTLENWIDLADPAPLQQIAEARAMLTPFPLGAGSGIAVSPDGKHGAFNRGDPLHAIWNDKLGPEIPKPAAYRPLFSPDSTTLLFSGYDGRGGDQGKYSLFTMAVGSTKPVKVKGTDGYDGDFASTSDNALQIITMLPPSIPACIQTVTLTAPIKVTQKRCLADADRDSSIALSPHGAMVAWITGEEARHRLRVMEVASGRMVTDAETSMLFAEVNDRGVVVARTVLGAALFRPGDVAGRALDRGGELSCDFRTDDELVCERAGGVVRYQLSW